MALKIEVLPHLLPCLTFPTPFKFISILPSLPRSYLQTGEDYHLPSRHGRRIHDLICVRK